jgi:hypothetical protein
MSLRLDTVQTTLKSVLESMPELAGVPIMIEDGAVDNDPQALDSLNSGKGLAIIVQRIARGDSIGDGIRPAKVEYIVPVTLQEKTARNRSADGTGKPAGELIHAILLAVLRYRHVGPATFALAPVPVVTLGAEHGLEEYALTFRSIVTYV